MKKKINSFIKLQGKKTLVILAFFCSFMIYFACNNSGTANSPVKSKNKMLLERPIAFSSAVPKDINNPSDPRQAAEFAWREFIAMTWPAKVNPTPGLSGYYRGQPSTIDSSGSTGSGGVVVWETFYHRDELYPVYPSATGNKLPNPDTIPFYNYGVTIPSLNGAKQNLFNNMDETSEITLAYMYYTPLAKRAEALRKSIAGPPTPAQQEMIRQAEIKAGIVYEAKGNPVIYKYLDSTGFNNSKPRAAARGMNMSLLTKNIKPTGSLFTLPYGSIEIKATWRHYDALNDNLNDFHWTRGIYYTADMHGNTYANNDTFVLVSLHIIQKTPNVPTFTFATFEHVSNERNGFRFINTNPGVVTGVLPRPLPDSFMRTAIRQFPIPDSTSKFDLASYNHSVQQQLRAQFGDSVVWANYQLIGIQAVVTDDPDSIVPAQQFFLSNFATETNDALQFFQGGLGGPDNNVPNPNTAHVFVYSKDSMRYIGHTSGGCLGCHGSQGQFAGGDFSVIAATGNNFFPEPVTPYDISKVYDQNPVGFPLPHNMPMLPASNKPLYYIPPHKKKSR